MKEILVRRLAGLAIILASAAAARAQPRSELPRRAELAAALDSIRLAIGAPGISAALVLPDGSVSTLVSGEAASGTPVSPQTVFDLGSITKSYTAALILRLVSEGALSLDDSLSRWMREVPGAHGVTIRDLLRQTSGLADYASHPEFLTTARAGIAGPWPPDENLRFVGPSRFTPGDRWEYSNTNYVLLGLIAQRVARHSYGELLRNRLLDSLGLTSTTVAGEDALPSSRAHAHLDFTGDGVPDDLTALVPDPVFTRGAGGAGAIRATAADLARFAHAYYSGAIVPSALHDEFARRVDRGDGWMYGFGMIEAPSDAGVLLGHLGNTAGQSAGVWHSPASKVTVVVLSNAHAIRMDAAVRRLLMLAVQ
jgi:D-alanyl-D-alanine carboxypeptidase